jgi:glycosyltransferase involved in cell wall biosynthesis
VRIAILTPYAPYPPNSGGRIRAWEQIRYLGQRHELTLVSFYDTEEEFAQRGRLNDYCRRVLMVRRPRRPAPGDLTALTGLSDLFRWYTTPEMAAALDQCRADRFDVVLLHHIFMAQYRESLSGSPVLQEHNIESGIFEQLAQLDVGADDGAARERLRTFRRSRWLLMRRYEDRTWPHFPLRLVVSDEDKRELDRRCPTGRTIVAENGVNTREISPLPLSTARRLLFMGSLDFYPNIDALVYLRDVILPRLWRRDPRVPVVIAGRSPDEAVRALARDPRIEVIANPVDIAPLAGECRVSVVPQRVGGGTRMRILHSMALGLPVVSTSRGCEGLEVTDGQHILVRDDPEGFVDAILELLADSDLAGRLRGAGRELVVARYDWAHLLESLEEELLAVASSKVG